MSSTHEGNLATTLSGSTKLFADAAQEESDEASSASRKLLSLTQQESNWTGDEKVEDTILRMLIDKHKPLQTGRIRSAEEKMKQISSNLSLAQEIVKADSSASETAPVMIPTKTSLLPASGSWASERLLPAIEGHQPWHTTFRSPSHATPSIKFAAITPTFLPNTSPTPIDDKTKRIEKEKKRKEIHSARLTQAKESTLDYRLGIKDSGRPFPRRINPTSIKGWMNLVEDRIECARQAGLFEAVKGRGKPLRSSSEDHNPFIGREEFLLNRILHKNQSAPPWVEVQGELETAVQTFRRLLAEAYVRRTVRILALDHPDPTLLSRLTLEDIRRHRDKEWINRERSYHETGIKEINALVRKYNALAPYSVRRNSYTREVEVGRLPDACAHEIVGNLRQRYATHGVGEPSLYSAQMPTPTIGSAGAGMLIWLKSIIHRFFRSRSSD